MGHVTFVGESERLRLPLVSAPTAAPSALRFVARAFIGV
jgi:hypothetical protein